MLQATTRLIMAYDQRYRRCFSTGPPSSCDFSQLDFILPSPNFHFLLQQTHERERERGRRLHQRSSVLRLSLALLTGDDEDRKGSSSVVGVSANSSG
ncbi:hypothetical protein L1987_37121 [Smallanthus sonchifolius]|uniref:Uncharacterized protein n=1 Tax=Smallanthus sonchifolius TaxID=185202 RepID=A0ACB9HFB8_9ASTR|nr:hypothetical protein L1987_37121 [Smallanthus sonchifolius]